MGSTRFWVWIFTVGTGSPPYTWGARWPNQLTGGFYGITPIYMGSTPGGIYRQGKPGDHPHIHGEHPTIDKQAIKAQGSPPYTWGAH